MALTKGYIQNQNTKETKKFQYNPENLSYGRSAVYSEIVSPGMSYPLLQFVRGESREFSVEIFMSVDPTQSTSPIKTFEKFLSGFLPPEKNAKTYKKPPTMLFCYGAFIKKCVVTSLEVSHDLFNSNLNPRISRFSLNLRQVV